MPTIDMKACLSTTVTPDSINGRETVTTRESEAFSSARRVPISRVATQKLCESKTFCGIGGRSGSVDFTSDNTARPVGSSLDDRLATWNRALNAKRKRLQRVNASKDLRIHAPTQMLFMLPENLIEWLAMGRR